MITEPTTVVVQRYLEALARDQPAPKGLLVALAPANDEANGKASVELPRDPPSVQHHALRMLRRRFTHG